MFFFLISPCLKFISNLILLIFHFVGFVIFPVVSFIMLDARINSAFSITERCCSVDEIGVRIPYTIPAPELGALMYALNNRTHKYLCTCVFFARAEGHRRLMHAHFGATIAISERPRMHALLADP